MEKPEILQVSSVTRWFSGLRALYNITLSVKEGDIVSIIGPNGAGKTTLFNCITGFIQPSSGAVVFNGDPLTGLKPHKVTKRGMARTFQSIRLFSEMSAIENVMVGGHSKSRAGIIGAILKTSKVVEEETRLWEKAKELLEFVGLRGKEQTLAVNLAYGDQRRLEIARGMASQPKLLLLDEPAAGMNPSETAGLIELIRQINSMGTTILLIEHDMKLVMNISDHVIVLDHGEKLSEGQPAEVQQDPAVIEAYLGVESA